MNLFRKIVLACCLLMVSSIAARAQEEIILPGGLPSKQNTRIPGPRTQPSQSTGPNRNVSTGQSDSLSFKHRDNRKDSASVSYRYLDAARRYNIDSSINDFDNYFSIPSTYRYLGNNGLAAFPLIFEQPRGAGWDAGFHAFDIYRFSLENTKIFKASKPFTSLSYQLASAKEQMISVLHTQNPSSNVNFGMEYKLINAPGFFVNQNTNNNSYRFFTHFTGKKNRYGGSVVLIKNSIRASENGGITADSILSDPNKTKRFSVPVNLGSDIYNPNPFASALKTGNSYDDFTFFYRHGYDLGKRDSIAINDSTTEYLFYPAVRFRHTFSYSSYKYDYRDQYADSALYSSWYGLTLDRASDSFELSESWKVMRNDFSIVQFPDSRNTAHYWLTGITREDFNSPGKSAFQNMKLHGEYCHPTRNRKWDMQFSGELYFSGWSKGDYQAKAYLSRYLNRKLGYLRLNFANVNRNPSYVFNDLSAFNLSNSGDLKKENSISYGAMAEGGLVKLGFQNHLLSNYTYFTDRYHKAQYGKVISVLQLTGSTAFRLSKRWKWYLDATFQQVDKAAPIKLPMLYGRGRLAYEGLFFKNLNLSAGLEARYHSAYYANDYSPVLGQFFPQDSILISNLPDISAFVHFRIRSFTGYFRAENLNTMTWSNGFGFTGNNFAALHYPTQGLVIRFGVRWFFVN